MNIVMGDGSGRWIPAAETLLHLHHPSFPNEARYVPRGMRVVMAVKPNSSTNPTGATADMVPANGLGIRYEDGRNLGSMMRLGWVHR